MTRPVVQDIWCWLESANKPYKGSSLKHIISNIDKITRCVCQQSNNQKDVIKRTTEKLISSKETNMNVTKLWLLTNSNKHSHEKLLATYTSDYSTSGITSSKWTVQRLTKLDEIASFSARMASPRCSWIDVRRCKALKNIPQCITSLQNRQVHRSYEVSAVNRQYTNALQPRTHPLEIVICCCTSLLL